MSAAPLCMFRLLAPGFELTGKWPIFQENWLVLFSANGLTIWQPKASPWVAIKSILLKAESPPHTALDTEAGHICRAFSPLSSPWRVTLGAAQGWHRMDRWPGNPILEKCAK